MLTAHQCEIIAYIGDGEIICRECAVAQESTVTIEKLDAGLSACTSLQPLIRYEVDEYNSERAHEYVEYELGLTWSDDPDAYDKAFEDYPKECCGSCGAELD